MDIGYRLKERRKELGLTVDDLAKLTGKSRATIYRYENGDIENMPTTILEPLAEALKTTPAYLMGWDEAMEPVQYTKTTNTDKTTKTPPSFMIELNTEMGDRIKERRLAMGYTQDELGALLGLQKSAIAKYENGRVENIKRSIIAKMSKILECSPAYLMGWEEKEVYSPGVPGQVNLLNVPICSSDISINESNLIEALRQLNKVAPEETESLYDIFTCIPTLPVELRKDIWEYSYLTIRKYHKEQMKKNQEMSSETTADNNDILLEMLTNPEDFWGESDTSSPLLNADHERTDIEATDKMKKLDDDIMDDSDF